MVNSPLTSWMFRGDTVDKVAVSGVTCVIALGFLAILRTTSHWGAADPPPPDPLARTGPAGDLANLDEDNKRAIFNRVAAAVNHFVGLETWQERLPHIRNGEQLRPLMETYYQKHGDGGAGTGKSRFGTQFDQTGRWPVRPPAGQEEPRRRTRPQSGLPSSR